MSDRDVDAINRKAREIVGLDRPPTGEPPLMDCPMCGHPLAYAAATGRGLPTGPCIVCGQPAEQGKNRCQEHSGQRLYQDSSVEVTAEQIRQMKLRGKQEDEL